MATARPSDWQLQAKGEIRRAQLSGNGAHIILITDADTGNVQCIHTKTGAVMWTATQRLKRRIFTGKFVDNDVYLLANADQYEFRSVADGTVLHTLPLVGGSWSDLLGEPWNGARSLQGYSEDSYEEVQTRFFGDMGIFYFNEGFQIIHLKNRAVLYESACPTSSVRYERWNNLLLVIPRDCSKAVLLDTARSEIVHSIDIDSRELADDIVQHFVAAGKQMFLFNERSVLCIDLTAKRLLATIGIRPGKVDSYIPIVSEKELYLLVSNDGTQSLYRCSDGERLWETAEGVIAGQVDFARLYNRDREVVMFTYESDGPMRVHKVDMETGRLLWSKKLFELDGSYSPGHSRPVDTEAMVGWGVAFGLIGALAASSQGKDFPEYMSAPNWSTIRYGTAPFKSSIGYAYLLDTANQSQLVIAMGGQIYTELQKTNRNDYDGEGFVVLDMADGSVINHTPMPIIGDLKTREEYNAVLLMTIVQSRQMDIVMGSHDVYTVSGQKVSRIPFDSEYDRISYISGLPDELFFSVGHRKNNYSYHRLDISSLPAKDVLCAQSTADNFIFPDTARFACMVRYNDGELSGFSLKTDKGESRDENALWKLSEDDLKKMELGSLKGKSRQRASTVDSLQGIRIIGGDVYIIGKDALGRISSDGRCQWSIPWSIKRREWTQPLARIGSYLVFSSGDDTRIIDITCDKATIVAKHDIAYGDVKILTDRNSEIIVLDTDKDILYGYHVK